MVDYVVDLVGNVCPMCRAVGKLLSPLSDQHPE